VEELGEGKGKILRFVRLKVKEMKGSIADAEKEYKEEEDRRAAEAAVNRPPSPRN
jgi:hypothetical protein